MPIVELQMMKDTKIQWHPGFIGAMNPELMKTRHKIITKNKFWPVYNHILLDFKILLV